MLISRKLLNRYVDIADIETSVLTKKLTDAGFEVEGVDTLMKGTNLVVGYVKSVEKHPDSDKLSVCQVDLGDRIEQIVCGASNVAANQHVVVAQIGSVLPGLEIKAAKVRGVESNGMICSLSELGIAEKYMTEEEKTGIVVLKDAKIGDDPAVVLGMDDTIIDVSITPNRSDFLAMFAVASEVAAIFKRPLTLPDYKGRSNVGDASALKINLNTEKSSHFLGKVINNVVIKPSPTWIKEALRALNINTINNVVDISNLVMVETGQPLHFYDFDFLKVQDLGVVDNFSGRVEALDGKEYVVETGDLVITNDGNPVGIAGIMGLGNSMIHSETKGLVIEVASFDRVNVRKTATRLGLSTESSSRFSKPMDPLAPIKAMDRAVDLLIKYADASGIEETVEAGSINYEPITVEVSLSHINGLLGTDLSHEVVMDVFERLNLNPHYVDELYTCSIPSYRNDLLIAEDLIEEVIRLVGYDVLEETLPNLDLTSGSLDHRQALIQSIETTLLGVGGYQTLSYTLVEEAYTKGAEALDDPIKLMSPMSDKRAYLRTQLLYSLLEVASYNNARRVDNGLYFEISKVYAKHETTEKLIMLGQGKLHNDNWLKENVNLDFYALKGIFMNLVEGLGFNARRFEFVADDFDDSVFHPYKSASILFDRKRIGVLGHIHPNVCKGFDLKDTAVLEVDIMPFIRGKHADIKAVNISQYPEVSRDLSIQCDRGTTSQELIKAIEKGGSRLLKDIKVFDIFESLKLGEQKSISVGLTFGSDHTLKDEEITGAMERITDNLLKIKNVSIR